MKKLISFFMVILMLAASVPYVHVSATESEAETYTLTIQNTYDDSSSVQNSAQGRFSFLGDAVYSGCYGNQLSDTAKELYDSMVEYYADGNGIGEYTYTFDTAFTFDAEISGNNIVMNDELEEISLTLDYSMQIAMDAFLYDHPEVFWLRIVSSSYSISASGNSSIGYTGVIDSITITPREIYSGASAKISQYDTAVEAALSAITVTESRYETLKNVHDYICNNAWYNLIDDYYVHSSEPVFIGDGGVVCEGYAKAFKVLCDKLSIPCVLVSGDAGGAHMWNYVQMDDGKWYLVDATWDDQESQIYDTYFLANANTIGFDDVAISEERTERTDFSGTGYFSFTYPVLSTTAYTVHIHDWDTEYTVDVEPTCTKTGSKSIHCSACDETKSVMEIAQKGHFWSSGTITTASTCKTQGTKTYTCLNDASHTKTERVALNADNHEGGTYLKDKSDAACTVNGYTGDTYCSGCDKKLASGESVAPTNHENKYIVDGKESTCTEIGYISGEYCPDCEKWLSGHDIIPVTDHNYTAVTTKATLSSDGKIENICVCGDVEGSEVIPSVASVTLSQTEYVYNGKNKTPKVTVRDAEGNILTKNVDYKTSVASKRSGIGKYTVKVTFIGKYEGTKKVCFTILPGVPATVKSASQTTSAVKLSWSAVPGAAGYTVYRYSPSKKAYVKAGSTEATTLTVRKLYAGTKYTFRVVAYGKTSSGKVYDSNGYKLLKTATKTATPTLSKVTAYTGRARLYWNNVSGETGYTVYYSTKSDSGFKKYANYKANSSGGYVKNLTSGKTYYFKVRTYIKTDSGYVYSAWSNIRSVKVK